MTPPDQRQLLERARAEHTCTCCGHLTSKAPDHATYEVCPICFWEDDALPHVRAPRRDERAADRESR